MLDNLLFVAPGNLLPAATAGLFGLIIGSFLNVVIHRLPRMMQREADDYLAFDSQNRDEAIKLGSPVTSITYQSDVPLPHEDQYNLNLPRSACPVCKHQITAVENIPIVSYLALRGKCSECKTPISIRYPIVELLTGALSALLIWQFGSGWLGLASLGFAFLLIAMTFIDADTQFLPDSLTYPLLWCGLLVNTMGLIVPLREAVIGAVAGYLSLWLVNWIFKIVRKMDGMGNGDFKLLAALGAWLGWKMLPLIVLLSALVGSVVGITLILLIKHDRKTAIPFGPYLAGAGMIALLFGKPILQTYLSLN
ncbi:MAG TPA: A24 family peptidase [Burkholderiaceae bacterium]|jgi:leader peptidase (prepilin peptidase)/N-methyltransferase|nr:A24 family peptidase [Burkholderiaceae bacterium]